MDLLRFITAGNVDDGKSTLIGRLLYDSKSILSDQLEALEKQTKNKANGAIDLALLTDGLRAEREQGITIDVAYKYFSTPRRKFIIADAPGHIQYTRNMVTGASNSDLIVVLVDARNGVTEQTRRHTIIASLLKIPQVLVTVNKMDLVNYDEAVYNQICDDYQQFADSLGIASVHYIPVSALTGDNIVERSSEMSWFKGQSVLEFLEQTDIEPVQHFEGDRFPVQYVIRPQVEALHDYRGYAGKITAGAFSPGQKVTIEPAGLSATVSAVEIAGVEVESAVAMQSVVIQLEEDLDISRGDLICSTEHPPLKDNTINAILCWMDQKPLQQGNKYLIQLNSNRLRVQVADIHYKLDVNTLDQLPPGASIGLNEVVSVTLKTAQLLAYDPYSQLRSGGGAILIDETSNLTVAALMIQ